MIITRNLMITIIPKEAGDALETALADTSERARIEADVERAIRGYLILRSLMTEYLEAEPGIIVVTIQENGNNA